MELASLQDSNSTPNGKDITISGLVLVRQKPPTAKGTTFLTIEDETGWANIVVQSKNYKRLRRQIMESRCLIARGKVQRAEGFVNLVAEDIVKVS
jgi:error-prone DNA polymerase